MSDTIIELKQLTIYDKQKDSKVLVNNVSITIPKGTVMGIVGESGSGKSLTMKSLMGILPANLIAQYDNFTFNGKDVKNANDLPLAMIFQDPMTSLNPLRTIGFHLVEVVQRHQNVSTKQAKEKALMMLDKVGITQPELRFNQYPFELSGGMRQRVMIAMALLVEPAVLIADEPTTALDVTIQLQILSLLYQLQQEMGLTVVIVSHDFGVIAGLCDYVTVMNNGQVLEQGTITDIFHHPQHAYTKKLLALAKFETTNQDDTPISIQGELVNISPTHLVRMEEQHV